MECTAKWPLEFSGLRVRTREVEDIMGKCGLGIKPLTSEKMLWAGLQRLLEVET